MRKEGPQVSAGPATRLAAVAALSLTRRPAPLSAPNSVLRPPWPSRLHGSEAPLNTVLAVAALSSIDQLNHKPSALGEAR